MTDKPRRYVYPLTMSADLNERVERARRRLGTSKAGALRLALRTGLLALERVDYDLAATVEAAAWLREVAESGGEVDEGRGMEKEGQGEGGV